jgi:hypothetical protein
MTFSSHGGILQRACLDIPESSEERQKQRSNPCPRERRNVSPSVLLSFAKFASVANKAQTD